MYIYIYVYTHVHIYHYPKIVDSHFAAVILGLRPRRLGSHRAGFGRKGCGAFGLLLPDSEFHHVYLERRCYYPLRDEGKLRSLGSEWPCALSINVYIYNVYICLYIYMIHNFIKCIFQTIVGKGQSARDI